MIEQEPPRTRLEQLLRQQHLTLEEFRKNYQRAANGTVLSERQAYRWVAGELSTLPYPAAQGTLEKMFGEPVARLFGPPYGIEALRPGRCQGGAAPGRGTARADWEGQVIAMSTDRARDFLTRIEASNVGAETLDQLIDDVRRLVVACQQQPLPTILGDLVDTQERAFTLLEGRQRPEQSRDLYLVAGIACGLMADASQGLGAFHDAMTQARAGYACADNAGHDGLRAWIRGLQAAFTYWSGRLEDSLRYAQLGAEIAARSRGSAGVWLASAEARALAALNRPAEAHTALARATDLRDRVQPDELDSLGGMCTFSRPRQLYFAAEALSWGGQPEALTDSTFGQFPPGGQGDDCGRERAGVAVMAGCVMLRASLPVKSPRWGVRSWQSPRNPGSPMTCCGRRGSGSSRPLPVVTACPVKNWPNWSTPGCSNTPRTTGWSSLTAITSPNSNEVSSAGYRIRTGGRGSGLC